MKSSVDAGPLAARLIARGELLGGGAVARAADAIARQPQPPGISAEALPDAVRLSGVRLKLRIVRDPAIGRVDR